MDFLIDAQLPPLLCNWIEDSPEHKARHVSELEKGLTSKDSEIWEVALNKDEIIITKDFDFYDRALVSETSPTILHIDLGNCSNPKLITYMGDNWENINSLFHHGYKLLSCQSKEIIYW